MVCDPEQDYWRVSLTSSIWQKAFCKGPHKKIMASQFATPGSANDLLLKKIRTLIKSAIDTGWRSDDPTLRIKTFPEHEFHTWTEDEISKYEEHWPIGSRERPTPSISTPVSAEPTSRAWHGQISRETPSTSCKPRPECVLHGLRKAAARRAWPRPDARKRKSPPLLATPRSRRWRATRGAADQARLAAGAVAKLTEQKSDKESQPSKIRVGKTGTLGCSSACRAAHA
jgi:hypothetical protein